MLKPCTILQYFADRSGSRHSPRIPACSGNVGWHVSLARIALLSGSDFEIRSITPPIIIAGAAGFDTETSQYLVSTALIVSGLLSTLQITRLHFKGTPYYFGTGLISVVGTSFSVIPVASAGLAQM